MAKERQLIIDGFRGYAIICIVARDVRASGFSSLKFSSYIRLSTLML